MAKKIKFNKINGNDTIANSITTLNQNFELLEDTLETQISKGVSSLQVKDVTWKTSGANGPSSTIELTNGNTAKINPIPSADEGQSGVITTVNQTISGKKTFKDGISTDSITDKKNRNIIITDGNTIYVGGNGGIKLVYDSEGNLKDVEYGFLKGIDISQILSQGNNSALEFERLRTYIESIKNEFNTKLEEQEDDIKNVAKSIAELNLDDLINQNDGMVDNYFGQPNEMQELYNEWIEHFEDHVGDTFTDIKNKKCYKFVKNGDSYEWKLLDESEYSAVVKALLNSLDAKSIADGKCTTFYQENIPAPCYTGDIWIVKKSFYMNGETQVDYIDGTTTVPEDTVVYYENTMLFCIQDNDTTTPDISVWGKDLSTWSEIQFQRNVEIRFDATEDALSDAQSAINEINNDNIFSVFEKRDFLNNTWYAIAGSYTFNSSDDIEYYPNGSPETNPSEGFLGTSTNGSFWNAVMNCIGDHDDINDYNTPLGELISSFKALAQFCQSNGLFESSIESSQFVTSAGNQTTGAVAKKELADLLYNYYREEEECRKSSYISSATTIMNDLVKQEDHKIQNWYINGVPTRQENMPWRKDDEDVLDYSTNDENHINDTCVDLNSPLGQAVYKFSKYENENEIKEGDIRIINTDTNFYWKNIKSSDISQIIDTLDIDTYIASLDGSINVFNTTPHDYTYGDIWFFNGFSDEDSQYHGHLNQQQKNMFVEGCIYYCKNKDLKGVESDSDGSDNNRKLLVPEDWENGYSKGNEFITKFANMASDTCLTPIEKNQLIRAFYEISGTNLYGNDNDETDNIIEDIFNDNESNDGSFRFVIRDVVKALLGTEINSYNDLTSFINGESSDSDYDELVSLVNNTIRKFKDIKTALISCGCLETNVDTDLTHITFSGFENLTKYNGTWNPSVHISMLSDVFATYYMEEDNLKTFSQQVRINDLDERLSGEISSVRDVSVAARDAADSANEAIKAINSDSVFTISEKSSFLNNTWRKIAGSGKDGVAAYNPNNTQLDENGKPKICYLGTGSNGSFWILVKDLDLRLSSNSNIVNKFKRLGEICYHFGLFDSQLQNSKFGTGVDGDYNANDLYDALFEYYNEEELIRKNVYTASVNETLDALRNQIDGKVSTFYGEGLPPSTQQGLSAYWEDANENHINDEYKDIRSTDNGGGKTYIFVAKTSETIITESDVEINEINYYWKGVDSSNISNIISQLEEAYDNVLAEMDGVIQIFGEADLPDEYNYGDIWFFGGIDKIIATNIGDYDLSKFVAGNIYYCEGVYEGSEKGFTEFNPIHWIVGSNAGDTTQKFAHMTSDDWLSVTEKQQLLDDWYEITGVNLSEVTSVNTLIQTINVKQNNRSSYSTTIQKYNEIIEEYNSHTDDGGDTGGGDTGGGDISAEPEEPTSTVFKDTKYINGTEDVTEKVNPSIIIEEDTVKLDFSESDYYIAGYYLDGDENTICPADADTNCKSITLNKNSEKVSFVYIFKITTYDDETNEIKVNISTESTTYTSDANGVKIVLTDENTQIKQYIPIYNGDGKEIDFEDSVVEFEYFFSDGIPSEIKIYLSIGKSYSSDIETTKTNLENSLKDIYRILVACECKKPVLSDSDLSKLNIPSDLSQDYGTGTFSSKPTILSDVFNRYYAEEKNLIVELTDLQVVNTVTTDPITVKELAEGIGGRGFVLSSLIQLEYNNSVVGGLDGVTEDGNGGFDNVGMWFGGTVENAKKTLNGTLEDGESPVPVIITKNGINSKIGPFKIGNSTTNEHIYIGDNTTGNTTVIGKDYISMGASYVNSDTKSVASENATIFLDRNGEGSKIGPLKIGSTIYIGNENSGNVTVIHNDYISMGATYANSNTKENAQQNSMIYLDKDGEGSRIGPLKIKKDSNNKILTFGNTTQVYSFKNTNDYYTELIELSDSDTREEKTIDGHTFSYDELNKTIQYGTNIVDFKNMTVVPDNFDYEMLPSMPRP